MVKGWREKTCPSSCEETNTQSLLDSPSTSRSKKQKTCWPASKDNKPCACITCWLRDRVSLRNVLVAMLFLLVLSLTIWGIIIVFSNTISDEENDYFLNDRSIDDTSTQEETGSSNDNLGDNNEKTDINAEADEINKDEDEINPKNSRQLLSFTQKLLSKNTYRHPQMNRISNKKALKAPENYKDIIKLKTKKNMNTNRVRKEFVDTNEDNAFHKNKKTIDENVATFPTNQKNSDTVLIDRLKPQTHKPMHHNLDTDDSFQDYSDDRNLEETYENKRNTVVTKNSCSEDSVPKKFHKTNGASRKNVLDKKENIQFIQNVNVEGFYKRRNLLSTNLNENELSLQHPKPTNIDPNPRITSGGMNVKYPYLKEGNIESAPVIKTSSNIPLVQSNEFYKNIDKKTTLSLNALPLYDPNKIGDLDDKYVKNGKTKKSINSTDEKKSYRARKVIKRSLVPGSNSISHKDCEKTKKDPDTVKTAQLMKKLVSLLEQVVDNQVAVRTCLHLPPDLRDFLSWVTSSSCPGLTWQNKLQDVAKYPPLYPTRFT